MPETRNDLSDYDECDSLECLNPATNIMRVKISANPPLPPVKAWFPLAHASTSTVLSFKSLLCTSLPAFRGISPSSLRLYIDGFELLDSSELTVVRDGDLISCVAAFLFLPMAHSHAASTYARYRSRTRPHETCPSRALLARHAHVQNRVRQHLRASESAARQRPLRPGSSLIPSLRAVPSRRPSPSRRPHQRSRDPCLRRRHRQLGQSGSALRESKVR